MSADLPLREEILNIFDAVAITSRTAFTFAGNESKGIAQPMMGLRVAPDAPSLMGELVGMLYQYCFCHKFTGRIEIEKSEPSVPANDASWAETLARANQSRERWEDAWEVVHAMPNGHIVAKRGGIVRMFSPGEFVNLSGSGMVLAPATSIRVYVPRASLTVQPGYYFMFGETFGDANDEFSIIRFYWNVSAEGVPNLLQLLSAELNHWRIPFRFKTGLNRAMLSRRDSAVLYTPRRYAEFTFALVAKVHKKVQPRLEDDVPLFALKLMPGLAFAEDPGTQESFGMARCRLLAQSIWAAHGKGARDADARWKIAQEQFQSEGISLDRPWLNAGSANEFAFASNLQEAA
jgi:hypothetical protein